MAFMELLWVAFGSAGWLVAGHMESSLHCMSPFSVLFSETRSILFCPRVSSFVSSYALGFCSGGSRRLWALAIDFETLVIRYRYE